MNLQQRNGDSRVFENCSLEEVVAHELKQCVSDISKIEALAGMFARLLEKAPLSTNDKLEIISYEWEEQ